MGEGTRKRQKFHSSPPLQFLNQTAISSLCTSPLLPSPRKTSNQTEPSFPSSNVPCIKRALSVIVPVASPQLSIGYSNCVGRLLSVGSHGGQMKSRDRGGEKLEPSDGPIERSRRAMELDPDMLQMKPSIVEEDKGNWKRSLKRRTSSSSSPLSHINNLDDGCLMHIFSFLSPIPDRYNTALVCHRWNYLACHPRLWLRVDRSAKDLSEPGVFPSIEAAVSAARPGDTILVAAGGSHRVSNIQIKKPICLIGAGELPDDTMLVCSRGSDSALELLSTCKLANLTVKAELGCCLLHRRGRLTIDGCILQCESNPLDYLSCPIVSTATSSEVNASSMKNNVDGVFVSQTRIEGGAKAVLTSGDLSLQRVRVIYARTSLLFWFDVQHL